MSSKPSSTSRRKPGRPVGSKNKQKSVVAKAQASRGAGRPRGSRNKNGYKEKPPAKISYAKQYMNASGAPVGKGNILDLIGILDRSIQKNWTDQKVAEHANDILSNAEFANACHFYSSSKGRLITDHNDFGACNLFPDVDLSVEFLEHFIHTSDDVLSYGSYVEVQKDLLQKRARAI